MTRIRAFFRRLFGRRATPTPRSICQCFAVPPSPDYAPHVIHRPDCPWLAAMCQLCAGTGYCQRCGGDGTDPGGKLDLLEDAAVLRRAASRLDGEEARALRTLLERIEGAP